MSPDELASSVEAKLTRLGEIEKRMLEFLHTSHVRCQFATPFGGISCQCWATYRNNLDISRCDEHLEVDYFELREADLVRWAEGR